MTKQKIEAPPEPKNWLIFQGQPDRSQLWTQDNHWTKDYFPPPPPWRNFRQTPDLRTVPEGIDWYSPAQQETKGQSFYINRDDPTGKKIIDAVNAALYLRRPLLVTGRPGTGKTSLATAIAYELQLGRVLRWPINTRSTYQEGLYLYDAIGRLRALQAKQQQSLLPEARVQAATDSDQEIGAFITLGPVGTAFLPYDRPRVLLIDEIDKSDINLPNDLLNLFEEGYYEIPELSRLTTHEPVRVKTNDGSGATIDRGRIECNPACFPLVIMTSNGEREFPAPFLRRCLRIIMPNFDTPELLMNVVQKHLHNLDEEKIMAHIQEFRKKDRDTLATDQLLNAVYLFMQDREGMDLERLREILWQSLAEA